MSIFDRNNVSWMTGFLGPFVTSIDSVAPFVFFLENQSIGANASTTITFPGSANSFFLVNSAFALRNSGSVIAVEVQGFLSPGPRAYYFSGPDDSKLFEGMFFQEMILREQAGIAGNWDLSMLGWRLDFTS